MSQKIVINRRSIATELNPNPDVLDPVQPRGAELKVVEEAPEEHEELYNDGGDLRGNRLGRGQTRNEVPQSGHGQRECEAGAKFNRKKRLEIPF